VIPGQVACSPARRTRQTLEGLRFTAPVEYDRRIYGGEPDTLLDVIGEQPEDADTLLVIGHNPSMHELCTLLTGTEPPRFPTAALALIEVAGAWSGVAGERARLVELWTPRD
jgi:phosphohistidine phosphatase